MRTRLSALANQTRLLAATLLLPVQRSTVYVGYVGRRNFGDDLLLDIYRRISGHPTLPVLDSFAVQPRLETTCVLGGGTVIGGDIYLRAIERLALRPQRVFCAGVIRGRLNPRWVPLLSRAAVFTRSVESRERLAELGIEALALVDPAVFCNSIYDRPDPAQPDRPAVLLAVHGDHPYLDSYTSVVRHLSGEERGSLIHFASSPVDVSLCRRLQREFGGEVLRGWKDVHASVDAISTARFVVSTRLHAGICAASFGTPYRMLAYDRKHHEFAASIDGHATLVDPAANFGPVLDDLRTSGHGILSGVRNWQDRMDEFRSHFARPL